jgi:hypothetical protein
VGAHRDELKEDWTHRFDWIRIIYIDRFAGAGPFTILALTGAQVRVACREIRTGAVQAAEAYVVVEAGRFQGQSGGCARKAHRPVDRLLIVSVEAGVAAARRILGYRLAIDVESKSQVASTAAIAVVRDPLVS